MRKTLTKIALTATLALALALTFGCTPDIEPLPPPNYSSSADNTDSSPSSNLPTPSSSSLALSSSSVSSSSSSAHSSSSVSSSSSLLSSSSEVKNYCNWAAIGGDGCWLIKNETERRDCGTAAVATCPGVSPSSSSLVQSSNSSPIIITGTFTDSRDGKVYKKVTIGTQTWMAENLNYNASGSKCYNYSESNCTTYGRLYNWSTANKACPSDWHLSSQAEWNVLSAYIESNKGCSDCAAKYLKATNGWDNGGNGLDSYGFSALPGGRSDSYDYFRNIGDGGSWWSSSESDEPYNGHMGDNIEYIFWTSGGGKSYFYSVRCLQNSSSSSSNSSPSSSSSLVVSAGTFTDSRDGKVYKKVTIDTQTWMAENLNYNASGSKCYNDQESNCTQYGRLYSWTTAMGIAKRYDTTFYNTYDGAKYHGVCPSGWHIPSSAEWNILMKVANPNCTDDTTCEGAGTKLKTTSGWRNDGNGTDDYGFSALPGGFGDYYNIGSSGNWWSSSETNEAHASSRAIYYHNDRVLYLYPEKRDLHSLRCIQD